MADHALLSPSGASRWIACPPSARLESTFPENKSEAADEGTLAHKLGEHLILSKIGRLTKAKLNKVIKEVESHRLYKNEMFDYADDYATYVVEQFNTARKKNKDAEIFVEEKIDLTDFIPEGFGTADAVIVADEVLYMTDLKYGKGVPVSAIDNSQLKTYGLGCYKVFSLMFSIKKLVLTIFQPRLDSISTFEISVEDIFEWANKVLIPKAKMAFDGDGEYAPGNHCLFCRAKAVCRANAEHNLQMAKYEFRATDLLTDEEISEILDQKDQFDVWMKAVSNYALDQAVNHGKKWPNYKLVEGRSVRKYKDEKEVTDSLTKNGYAVHIFMNMKLKGLGEMKNALGKHAFESLIDPLLIKPPGKVKLAPQSDKRPEINSVASAKADFEDEDSDD